MADTLHLQVIGGLVSRLRAVAGGIAYCEATGATLVVDWPPWEPSEDSGDFLATLADIWQHPYQETRITNRGRPVFFPKKPAVLNQPGATARFRTCEIEPFLPYMTKPIGDYFKAHSPSQTVQDYIANVTPFTTRSTVGVQVRRSNKDPSTVPCDWFFDRIHYYLGSMPEANLFLSCDTAETEAMFRDQFGDRVTCQNKTYRYDRDGIVKSAADLYLLAMCGWVLGSNHSSYSQMVAFLMGASYTGWHEKPGGISGGRYEDAWNLKQLHEFEEAMR